MKNIWRITITFGVGLVFAVIFMFARDLFSQTDLKEIYKILSDSFGVPGLIITAFGILVFASNGGVFDIFGYALVMLRDVLKRDLSKRQYKNYGEYRAVKRENSLQCSFLVIGGLILVAISTIFVILFNSI